MISQSQIPLLVAILVFLMICLLSIGIYQYIVLIMKKRTIVSKIKQGRSDYNPNIDNDTNELKKGRHYLLKLLAFLSLCGSKVTPRKSIDYSSMRLRFLRSGIRYSKAIFAFYGCKFMLALVFPVCYLFIRHAFALLVPSNWNLLICLSFALIGYFFPDIWLNLRCKERQDRILKGFPDALDLLVVCVEAGIGLDAAIYRVAEEMSLSNKDISAEFKQVNFELRSGKARQEALNNLALRTNLDEVKNFVGLLNQTFQFGTNVSNALRVYSDTFRTNRRQKAEEVAAKLPTKLMLSCVFFIFPAIFVVTVGPAAIQIYNVIIK